MAMLQRPLFKDRSSSARVSPRSPLDCVRHHCQTDQRPAGPHQQPPTLDRDRSHESTSKLLTATLNKR
jgi:hypothetical protein